MAPKNGSEIEALTSGNFPIFRPHLTPDGEAFILNAEIPDPFEMQSFLLPLQGGELSAITSGYGRAEGKMSPGGRYFAYIASSSSEPWELYIKPMDSKERGTKVTDSPSPAYKSYNWMKPEIIHFAAQDGAQVPAKLYRPAMPHPDKPAVIFAHGAGWLHNVHRWWPSYSKEHCFHYLLMEKGLTVMDIDFRGSSGYGRNWSTATYRKETAGKTSDVVDGSRYLVKTLNTNPEHIGIYGGSGGGVITLHALFQYPDHFGAGAALRPLPDYFHYDFWNPRTILGDPYVNPEAYISASPIYHAEGLKDPLLICIGLSDTNTHFQGVVRLVQRLIELRKSGWELAVYPMESHSFKEPSSWSDEYRRILELFEKNLKKSGNE
jgi:dipeptidyl aminopeptidase/acylaminoacyl peptidase